ncbi:metallophosphoesterase family protein [Sulfitobacter sp. S190]|uniref:metallophosphoesterase family protein n=1 Tax=Sulfitobacter sp. S190 TaxID=2867022 RepID=UPI0021A784C4|nr:metallophosphoesterase family protein [Sulfitobacter sp. S190]UWR22417.1 serine/threonine protein phosphatase [Sulfitobacter sp. S190]
MKEAIYAIGDIHGQLGELQRVLSLIEADGGPDARIVLLGDYTDRGPDSRGVLDLLVAAQKEGRNWTFLKGNHDRMFEWFMQAYPKYDAYLPVELSWLHPRLGGDTTLASYGVDVSPQDRQLTIHAQAREAVPPEHIAFLSSLPLSAESETHFFCHAGVLPGVPLDRQDEEDLLWIRQQFHKDTRQHPKVIVHGHTPVAAATDYGNRINLDAGAGYGKPLAAAVFDKGGVFQLTDRGRQPLHVEI